MDDSVAYDLPPSVAARSASATKATGAEVRSACNARMSSSDDRGGRYHFSEALDCIQEAGRGFAELRELAGERWADVADQAPTVYAVWGGGATPAQALYMVGLILPPKTAAA
jgi:hypothetical protein